MLARMLTRYEDDEEYERELATHIAAVAVGGFSGGDGPWRKIL